MYTGLLVYTPNLDCGTLVEVILNGYPSHPDKGMLHSQEGVQYGHMNHLEQIKLSTCVGTKITR